MLGILLIHDELYRIKSALTSRNLRFKRVLDKIIPYINYLILKNTTFHFVRIYINFTIKVIKFSQICLNLFNYHYFFTAKIFLFY